MMRKVAAGKPAEIAFTCDFHELASGDLRPEGVLLLRYDPHRIVPEDEPSCFGDPASPVLAHVAFREDEAAVVLPLRSRAGLIACPALDRRGQVSMLEASLQVPADAEYVSIWFTYRAASGQTLYDSDFGANYRFGFACLEIGEVEAGVVRSQSSCDRFEVRVSAACEIERMTVRFWLVHQHPCSKGEFPLRPQQGDVQAGKLWVGAADVAPGAIVRFKLFYWRSGRRLKDDNGGAYYLAPEPALHRIPPPPAALIEAAAGWR